MTLPNDTVSKLLRQRELENEQKSIIIENQEEYKKALNGMASTPNGDLVLKTLIKAMRVFDPVTAQNNVALIECNAQKNLYLTYIRPYLTPELKQEIEK